MKSLVLALYKVVVKFEWQSFLSECNIVYPMESSQFTVNSSEFVKKFTIEFNFGTL